MQKVGDVNLKTYTAVHPNEYYAQISISETGSVRHTEPITNGILHFLTSIGLDVSIWNGIHGVLGRSYVAPSSLEGEELSLEGINKLRTLYIDVKRSLYIDTTRQKLQRDFETQNKLQTQLDRSVVEIEEKIEQIRKKLCSHDVRKGDQWDLHDPLSKSLKSLEEELGPSKNAAEAICRKVLQTRIDIAENETGFLRRYAILRTIFCENSTWKVVSRHYYKGDGDLVSLAKAADKKAASSWLKMLLAKRFYVDAKLGLVHLYKVENTLKSVLENLGQAMQVQKGIPCEATSSIPSQVGVEYRLGYVRQLWSSVDPSFKHAVAYIVRTSLRDRTGFILSEDIAEESGSDSPFEKSPKEYGTFMKGNCILPSFSKIELAHPLNKAARISALHKSACAAYKVMNKIYDSQELWIQKAMVELREREQEERISNDNLIDVWERLLAIDTKNM